MASKIFSIALLLAACANASKETLDQVDASLFEDEVEPDGEREAGFEQQKSQGVTPEDLLALSDDQSEIITKFNDWASYEGISYSTKAELDAAVKNWIQNNRKIREQNEKAKKSTEVHPVIYGHNGNSGLNHDQIIRNLGLIEGEYRASVLGNVQDAS